LGSLEMASIRMHVLGRFLVTPDGRPGADDAWQPGGANRVFKLLVTRTRHRLFHGERG